MPSSGKSQKASKSEPSEIRELKLRIHELEKLANQREHLITEVNHRVKNTLQLVSSVLTLQALKAVAREARDALTDAAERTGIIGRLHGMLTRNAAGLQDIDLRAAFADVSAGLRNDEATIKIELPANLTTLRADVAVNTTLIAYELVTNALKYAFTRGARGSIDVRLERLTADRFSLTVADNGIGMPKRRKDGIGLSLVRSLAEQMSGTVTVSKTTGGGATIRVTLCLEPEAAISSRP